MDYGKILEEIGRELQPFLGKGKVADYIPLLAEVDPNKFGMVVHTVDGKQYSYGDANEPFSIQSISKVFMYILAMNDLGADVWKRIGREPSGNPFNSLVQLEYEKGIPRNPFINAGALVVTDIVMSHCQDAKGRLLEFVREQARNPAINFDMKVVASERAFGHRNRALTSFLKSFGNIHNDVEDVLDVYFHQCAIAMSCHDLSNAFMFLANGGLSPITGKRVTIPSRTKRANALMLTWGLYDEGGDFAFRVGLPGKSGVGGGIAAVLPKELTVTVWGPGLNNAHNSLVGLQALEWFTTKTGKSIF